VSRRARKKRPGRWRSRLWSLAEAGGDLGEDFAEGGRAGPCAEVDGLGNLPDVADGGVNEGFELREGDGEEQGADEREIAWVGEMDARGERS
jgi:hypothetical protein